MDLEKGGEDLTVFFCTWRNILYDNHLVEGSQVLLELRERVESILACNLAKVRKTLSWEENVK